MKLSLETSKLLKECGFPQGTEWFWYKGYSPKENSWLTTLGLKNEKYIHHSSGYACPTSDEILELLPVKIILHNGEEGVFRVEITEYSGIREYECGYMGQNDFRYYYGKNLPEALAQTYIFLRREKLI